MTDEARVFQAAMCSDHLAPWSECQGHSGHAWSWVGPAMQASTLPFGVVTAPGQRDWRRDRRPHGTHRAHRLLAGFRVSRIWLMPFQPSPNRDDGYDIADYYGVDSRLGTLGNFVALVRSAKDRRLRVIIDLVVNHTSDRHPWFRAAPRSGHW